MDRKLNKEARHAHQDPRQAGNDKMRSQNSPRPVDFGAFKNRAPGHLPQNVNWYRKAPKHGGE